jgi:polygalacturonase
MPLISIRPIHLLMPALAAVSFAAAGVAATVSAATVEVARYGAIGDGATLNTTAIQSAIDDCSNRGGGKVLFPPGRYLTGTIQIKSGVTLRLDKGATLLGSTKAADYRNLDPFIDGTGNPLGYALIVASDAKNVGIEGGGTVDGQSHGLKAKQNPYVIRPFLMRWLRCTNVTVRDLQLTNPGAWTLNFYRVRGIRVEDVTIRSRHAGVVNNDGIDLDSCQDARITDCDIDSGDDALCLKSTGSIPTRNVIAKNLKLSTKCNAIKLGTESLGGFDNIKVSHCQLANVDMAGIALYEVDGRNLQNVTVSDVTMDGVAVPISIRLGARLRTFREGDQPMPAPGKLRDVTIQNVSAKNIGLIGMLISGVPGYPAENLTFENIQFELRGGGTAEAAKVQLPEKEKAYPEYSMFGRTMPAYGIYARHVSGVKFKNVQMTLLKPDARPASVFVDVKDVTPAGFAAGSSNSEPATSAVQAQPGVPEASGVSR